MLKNIGLTYSLILLSISVISQTDLDSLWNVYTTNQNDSLRLKALSEYGQNTLYNDLDSAYKLSYLIRAEANRVFEQDSKYKNYAKRIKGTSVMLKGSYYLFKGNVDSTFFYYDSATHFFQSAGYQVGVAKIYNNEGLLYEKIGELDSAMVLFERSLNIKQKLGDKEGVISTLGNIGLIYDDKGDYANALNYYLDGLKIAEEIGDQKNIFYSYISVGNVEKKLGNESKSIEYYKKSLEVAEGLNNKAYLGMAYSSLAGEYKYSNEWESYKLFLKSAACYNENAVTEHLLNVRLNQALTLNALAKRNIDSIKELNSDFYFDSKKQLLDSALYYIDYVDSKGVQMMSRYNKIYSYSAKGTNLLLRGDIHGAIKEFTASKNLAESSGQYYEYSNACNNLYRCYSKTGDYRNAFNNLEEYMISKDSLFNEEKRKKAMIKQFEYEYDKKIFEDSLAYDAEKKILLADKKREEEKSELEKQQQRLIIYLVVVGLVIVSIFLILVFNRFKLTKRQNAIINKQREEVVLAKEELEIKNTEVLDSIKYAKRIQDALLKSEEDGSEKLLDHFILFLPKDIVSGDFYWIFEKENHVYFAVADCTGHGVPGAFLTMLGSSFLNEINTHEEMLSPATILDRLRDKMINELSQKGEEGGSKDGMDISLVKIDLNSKKIEWAGANNPIYIISEEGLTETKADKQAIGYGYSMQAFTNHSFQLKEGNIIYLFSDGFADQFGGEKGKKYKYSTFRNKLIEIHKQSTVKQKEILAKEFDIWRGNFEQIDDVCVIGVRI